MCKKVINILDSVLNVLGSKKKRFVYNLTDDITPVTLNIVWSGKALQFCYTSRVRKWHVLRGDKIIQEKHNYAYGNMTAETINIHRGTIGIVITSIENNIVYIDCTNVTYLEINGEQFI